MLLEKFVSALVGRNNFTLFTQEDELEFVSSRSRGPRAEVQ